MWPLSEHRCRWSFQVLDADLIRPARLGLQFVDGDVENAMRDHAHRLLRERAPWFQGQIEEIDWWTAARFERRLVEEFAVGRCSLAGDAAHRTSPVGMHSMNVGLREARDLAHIIGDALSGAPALNVFAAYANKYKREWQRLLGSWKAFNGHGWAAPHRNRLVSCIAASGEELTTLLRQVGVFDREGVYPPFEGNSYGR
jgi:2-polyprenyl-6-methoxyphenol hydroxylase-like FAD-dependent oxidoreductase